MKTTRALALLAAVMLWCARPLAGQNGAADHPDTYAPADVSAGAGLYNIHCLNCHGPSGTGVGGIDLRHGVLPRARTDAALQGVITTGFPQAGMPAFRLSPDEIRALTAFVRSGFDAAADARSVMLGDAARGKALYDGKGNCSACHRVNDNGRFSGPDLTDVGQTRTPEGIQRSLVDPTAAMRPINRPVRAVTRGGKVITGRRLNEDTYSVQVITDQGQLVSLEKAELRQWSVGTASPMPSYRGALTAGELADLLAYLVSLKG